MTKPQNIIYAIPENTVYRKYKHSDSVTDFQIDWREYLESSETISSQTISANNITVDSSSSSGQVSTVFLSGGDSESNSYIDITIVTDNATARTFKIRVYFYAEYNTNFHDSIYYT